MTFFFLVFFRSHCCIGNIVGAVFCTVYIRNLIKTERDSYPRLFKRRMCFLGAVIPAVSEN